MRMRTPIVRAASTKPAAAIVLPEAVGWRNRKRRTAPGSLLLRLLVLLDVLLLALLVVIGLLEGSAVCLAVSISVLGLFLVTRNQLGEHSGERVDLVATELRAGGEAGRMVGQLRAPGRA